MQAIIFDMDGVLVDSIGVHMKIWRSIFEKRGLTFDKEGFKKYNGTSSKQIAMRLIEEFSLEDTPENILSEKIAYDSRYLDELRLFPRTKSVLSRLKKSYRLALATSARKEMLDHIDSRFGLLSFFDAAVHSDMVQNSKPAPDLFMRAAEDLGIEYSQCMVVEDSINGIIAARKAGMEAIAITNTFSADSFHMADRVIHVLSELEAFK
ncbi:MAG: HAD family phosphatase [Candidatus Woesearchaeota archaeon]